MKAHEQGQTAPEHRGSELLLGSHGEEWLQRCEVSTGKEGNRFKAPALSERSESKALTKDHHAPVSFDGFDRHLDTRERAHVGEGSSGCAGRLQVSGDHSGRKAPVGWIGEDYGERRVEVSLRVEVDGDRGVWFTESLGTHPARIGEHDREDDRSRRQEEKLFAKRDAGVPVPDPLQISRARVRQSHGQPPSSFDSSARRCSTRSRRLWVSRKLCAAFPNPATVPYRVRASRNASAARER